MFDAFFQGNELEMLEMLVTAVLSVYSCTFCLLMELCKVELGDSKKTRFDSMYFRLDFIYQCIVYLLHHS